MRARLLLASILLPLVLWAALPLPSSGRTKQEELNSLHNRIDEARKKIGRKKGTERVLTTQIAGYTRRINRLQGTITTLSAPSSSPCAPSCARSARGSRGCARSSFATGPCCARGSSRSTRPASPT